MRKILLSIVIILTVFVFSQTINIHKTDGTTDSYNFSDIKNITFTISDSITGGFVFENFGITSANYASDADWNQACEDIFGSEYRVADWNDLENYYFDGGKLSQLLDSLGLTEYRDNAFVKYDGQQFQSGSRAYFIERHDHNKPVGFSAHEQIDNYMISLGSWELTKPVIVHRK